MRPTCCCLSAARSSMGALRPSAPAFATPKSPRSRLSAVLASKDATAPKLTLQHFVLRGEAISLYRKFLRATRGEQHAGRAILGRMGCLAAAHTPSARDSTDIPNPEARLETVEWIRSDFDRTRIETDLVSLQIGRPGFCTLLHRLCAHDSWLTPSQERIRDYLMQGHRQLKQLQGPFRLSNATQDFAKLRGRRKAEAVA